ncbi:RluA family pseudouridine synthase [Candidatus Phytoplasma pini]|uniref:Pseudouridine synthase n=1 Tax=Candidatus Phytoplasma pini TaxID=267362 RepID=A0A559KK12_9MOLU|nr:RluA family pseudouridine synthase [Candidatus Phytoplasma pini]TVY12466.1 Pseudouridylate synthase [Candidatus Phytoplasma pini]
MKSFIVAQKEHGFRLDFFLAQKLNLSRNKSCFLIMNKSIFVNNQIVKKSYFLKKDDFVTFQQDKKPLSFAIDDYRPINLNLQIIYEDDYLIVINKPPNLVTHPCLSYTGVTLINGLLYQIKDFSKLKGFRPGIIHRLDKDTTGLILVGKKDEIVVEMQKMLQQKKIKRIYWALIHGFLGYKGTINLPINRDHNNRLKKMVFFKGKNAITHFKTIRRFENFSLLELELETGRTHQIRVHLSYLQHPIVGDPLYGRKTQKEPQMQLLHSKNIIFIHPKTKKSLFFESTLFPHFQEFLNQLLSKSKM